MQTSVTHTCPTVSVVIPVLNAAKYLPDLLAAIFSQQPCAPQEVILVDSMSTDDSCAIAARDPRVRVIPVEHFTHGGARNLGVRAAQGEMVALLTQDALPRDVTWLETLLQPLRDPQVVAAFSRQEPRAEASPMERYFLQTHFPNGAPVRMSQAPGQAVSFQKGLFFSNVSAVIRREILLQHPFDETLIMSEDQQFARDVLRAGYAVVYEPRSVVIHSHNYTLPVVFKRYFDSVYSLTQLFSDHDMGASASMGLRYLGHEAVFMVRHHPLWLPYYFLYTVCKASGTLAGHFAEHLPQWALRRLSLHGYHWKNPAVSSS